MFAVFCRLVSNFVGQQNSYIVGTCKWISSLFGEKQFSVFFFFTSHGNKYKFLMRSKPHIKQKDKGMSAIMHVCNVVEPSIEAFACL